MEKTSNTSKICRKREPNPPETASDFDSATFPLILASADTDAGRRLVLSLLRLVSPPLPNSIVAILPLLLRSRWPLVVALSAEIIGATAIYSVEANEVMARDVGVVSGLVSALGSESRRVVEASCHAVMDLSSSRIGRERLQEAFAVEKLLSLFVQVASVSDNCQGIGNYRSENNRSWLTKDFLKLILDATTILINTANDSCLDRIPQDLIERYLTLFSAWGDKSEDLTSPWNCRSLFKLTDYSLAETIFRLSIYQIKPVLWDFNKIRTSLFGSRESEFENFILHYWEKIPLIFSATSRDLENDSVLSSLLHSFDHQTIDDILDLIFLRSVSCPPIGSDVLDVKAFLNEASGSLGTSIVYGQDFRVVKSCQLDDGSSNAKREVHLFGANSMMSINEKSALECKEAFHNGFTIAVRGMELRFPVIAAIVEGLADLFGQPSVGANLYLTPPNSQGLACHYDDHCVLVWQLFGKKQWTISSSAASVLPRLYEPLATLTAFDKDMNGYTQVSLIKGDILYIPRGYGHEAHTLSATCGSKDEKSDGFSLHLTFAVEVEPPFEWEGFMHIALHCWHEKQKQSTCILSSRSRRLQVMSILILHIGIRIIADCTPVFRTACLVGAKFSLSENRGDNCKKHTFLNPRSIFSHLVSTIGASCNFNEAFMSIEQVVQERKADAFQWMRWLRHLPQNGNEDDNIDFDIPFAAVVEHFKSYSECISELAAQFSLMKCAFCEAVEYEDACNSFITLLNRYRKTRRQYMKGMLSLNSI